MEQYTEKELIQELRNLGCTDEFKYSKGRSSLRGNSHAKFLTTVEQYFAHVSFEGTGAKRIYTVDGIHDKVQPRKSKNNGSPLTIENSIMHQYIFQRLQAVMDLVDDDANMSLSQWCNTIGFRDVEAEKHEHINEAIINIHSGYEMKFNSKQIEQDFYSSVRNRNLEVLKLALTKLEGENKIIVTEKYMFKHVDGNFEEMDKLHFEKVRATEIKLAEQHDMDSKMYFLLKGQKYIPSKTNNLIIDNIKKLLSEEFGLSYTFKTYHISVLDKGTQPSVTGEEFLKAFTDRMVKLAIDRKNSKQKNTQQKLFYTVNTIFLLSVTGFNLSQSLVDDELETIPHLYKKYSQLSNEKSLIDNGGDMLIRDMERSILLEKMML